MDIREVEEKMQTPAWRLADSLRQRVYETKIAVEHSVGSTAREKLGELRCLLRLGIFHGSIQKQEAQQVLDICARSSPSFSSRSLTTASRASPRGCAASFRAGAEGAGRFASAPR